MTDEYKPKREFRRTPLSIDVRVTQIGLEAMGELIFETGDLSPGGAFLKSELLLEVGDQVELAFELPDSTRTIRARASVVWATRAERDEKYPGMGMEFTQLLESDERALKEFLNR